MRSLLGAGWRRTGRLRRVAVPNYSGKLFRVELGDAYGAGGLPPHIITYLGRHYHTVIQPELDSTGAARLALYVRRSE